MMTEKGDKASELDPRADDDFASWPSTMPNIGVDLSYFPDEESARSVGNAVLAGLHQLGKMLNLERLVQVIVSYDYQSSLAGLDRGFATSQPLSATNDEIAVGVAMAPVVIRDGQAKAIMVLNAVYVSQLAKGEGSELTS